MLINLLVKLETMSPQKEGREKVDMRGFDYKAKLTPCVYNNYAADKFNSWDELFLSYMVALDSKWEVVFQAVRARGDKVMRKAPTPTAFCLTSGWPKSIIIKCRECCGRPFSHLRVGVHTR